MKIFFDAVLLIVFCICTEINSTFISRAAWGARNPAGPIMPLKIIPPPFIVIHHSATEQCFDFSSCKKIVRSIQNYHINVKKWSDIGYNFLVGGDGNIYEGRGWNKSGAHTKTYNNKSIGICFIGNYDNIVPTHITVNFTKLFIKKAIASNFIAKHNILLGHRQVASTMCPGNKLFKEIESWGNFTM